MLLKHNQGETVVDLIHNVTIADPYRWLEDRQMPETERWITEQNKTLNDYFAFLPNLEAFRQRVKRYLDVEWRDQPVRVARYLFYRHRKQGQEQACICMRESSDDRDRTLVDPSPLGAFASVAIHRISADARLLAYELRYKGSDATAIHIVDTFTGCTLPDSLPSGDARGFAFTNNRDGFYYCHEIEDRYRDHVVRIHRLGSSSTVDIDLFHVPRMAQSRLELIADEIHLGGIYTHEHPDGLRIDLYLATHEDPFCWRATSLNQRMPYAPFFDHGRIFILTEEDAPNRKLIEIFKSSTVPKEVVRESDSLIHEVLIARSTIYVRYFVERHTAIHVWTLEGVRAGSINLPVLPLPGTITLLPSPRSESTFFYSVESFVQPPQILECSTDFGSPTPAFDSSYMDGQIVACRVEDTTYHSSDGATIPLLLQMRADLDLSHPNPTILTSYGGFGVSATPKFSVMATILLELGVLIAMPGIRGGSEFGKAWHEAARGKNRQASFDDFLGAAECLISTGVTRLGELASYGASNSALLVAVAMTQRPDLFRAVLCIGPLLDMVRYERFSRARSWVKEFGSVNDPGEFQVLLSYSPYHHVQSEINYPPILLVTGDGDDRCDPAHVRKMAALLQRRDAQKYPVLVDYSRERGHRPGLPMTARIDAIARRIGFLAKELGIRIPQGGLCETPRC
jgi:prolyl oligopeptidase